MKLIYLGMALSETPEWWRIGFHNLVREKLDEIPDVSVSRFVGLDNTTNATQVYSYDINLASEADLMVALTRFPSIGLGMEIQARVALGKQTILFHPAGSYLSKMPRGAPHTRWRSYFSADQDDIHQALQISDDVKDELSSLVVQH